MEKTCIFTIGEDWMPRHVLFLLGFYYICISIGACDRMKGKVILLPLKRPSWLQLPVQNKNISFRSEQRLVISYAEYVIQMLLIPLI